jgi:Dienelactone hydrolase family
MAVAPEIYFRNPDFPKMTDTQQIMREVILKAPDVQIMSDLDATLDWAAHNRGNGARMAEIGFCFGGRNTWLYAAHNPHLKAAVAFYGPHQEPDVRYQAEDGARHRRPTALPGARTVWRAGSDHSGGPDPPGGSQGEGGRQDGRDRHLSGRAARLPCGLPAESPQGSARSPG